MHSNEYKVYICINILIITKLTELIEILGVRNKSLT